MTEVPAIDLISKLPKRIFIDQYEFRLKLLPEDAPELAASVGDEITGDHSKDGQSEGLTYFDKKLICLCKDLSLHLFVEVVIHEVVHSINWSRDIEDGITEEEFTTKFSPGFVRFLLDNPRFHQWLNRAIREIRKQQTDVGNILD